MANSFERKVLAALQSIPRGRITTYKLLARAVGAPAASRAVGNALNKNPRPIVVPCHRVVCSNGQVGGYRFGQAKKIALLEKEGIQIDQHNRIAQFHTLVFDFNF